MRKIIKWMMVLVMAVGCAAAMTIVAEAATEGDFTYTVSGEKATITAFNKEATGEVVIPDTLGGYPVTAIGGSAFTDCTSLKKITVPKSVTSIGDGAFKGCTSLEEMTLPFVGMSREEKDLSTNIYTGVLGIIFGYEKTSNGNWSADDVVYQYYENNSRSYYHYYIPSTLRKVTITDAAQIPRHAFYNCDMLTEININEGITKIEYNAFYNCTGITEITIPESVTGMWTYAFYGCEGLTKVNAASVEAWSKIGFGDEKANPTYYGKKLYVDGKEVTTVTIPEGITKVSGYAFINCEDITTITVPASAASIGKYAFSGCSSLVNVTLPEGITTIGEYAFTDCTSLKKITVPKSVTEIGDSAFKGCTSLEEMTLPFVGMSKEAENEKSVFGIIFGYTTADRSSTIVDGAIYQYSRSYTYYHYYIPSTLRKVTITDAAQIPRHAFYNCDMLTEININEGITKIEYNAFYNCTGITEITIPESVTGMWTYAFYGCEGLTKVNAASVEAWSKIGFGDEKANPTYYGKKLYVDGKEVTTVTIPEGITKVSGYAFINCEDITTITVPASAASIGKYAFSGCSSLVNVTLPEGITTIGEYAFTDCTSLKKITVPKSVTEIGDSAFKGCTSLEEMTLPFVGMSKEAENEKSVFGIIFGYTTADRSSTIVDGAIYQYSRSYTYYHYYIPSSLRKVTITDAARIPWHAFSNCNMLTEVNINEGITTIDGKAFSGCSGITEITVPGSVTSIGSSAFSGCTKLAGVNLPETITNISSGAFSGAPVAADENRVDGNLYIDNILISSKSGGTGTLKIREGTTAIADSAVSGRGYAEVILPDSVKAIGTSAFSSCRSLKTVVLGKALSNIKTNAFSGCSAIEIAAYRGCSAEWADVTVASGNESLTNKLVKDSIFVYLKDVDGGIIATELTTARSRFNYEIVPEKSEHT